MGYRTSSSQRIGSLNGCDLLVPISGGKAGFGCNKSSSIQVWSGNFIVKQFRFTLDGPQSRSKALKKAMDFARSYKD